MDYSHTQDYPGDSTRALEHIVETFSQLGFRIEKRDPRSVQLTGPGMNNTRQSPLVGVSALSIEARPGSIALAANFGAIDRLLRLMSIIMLSLLVFLLVLFAFVFRDNPDYHMWITLLPFLPWVVLHPLLRSILRRRLKRALDNLLHNVAMMAR
jgi:hypothetical protein